jgi:hypothetical protein
MRQEYYEAAGVIVSGELKPVALVAFRQAMKRFPDGQVTIRVDIAKPKRSAQQNRFWHGIVIPAFAEHCGYEFNEMKDVLALKLLPKEIVDMDSGEVRIVPGHTSDLSTKEFNDLIERAQRLGAELNVYIPDPGEVAA